MLRTELQKLMETSVGHQELDRAKRYLIGRHDIDLQKNSAIANSILFDDIYGVSYKETYNYGEKINAVTSENVLELAQSIFSKPELISVVGSECPW